MSMHNAEFYVEVAICAVAECDKPVQYKRNFIHTMFTLESGCDCGFTNLRTIEQMAASQYSFLFNRTEMFDYTERKDFYDNIENKPFFDMGDVYVVEDFDGVDPAMVGKVCVDSGSAAWEGMVKAGKITGEGAKPVGMLDFAEALIESRKLIEAYEKSELDDYEMGGLYELFFCNSLEEAALPEQIKDLFGMSLEEIMEMADL